jgi:heavy metal translocating P-type ATPase
MSVACVYCGLTVPAGWWREPAHNEPMYCCFGCRFAHAVTQERRSAAGPINTLARLGISIFFAMNVMAFTMVLWGEHVYDVDVVGDPLAGRMYGLFRTLCLVFSAPVLVLLGIPLAADAWRAIRVGRPNADVLLLTGVIASFVISALSVLRGSGPIYFEVGVVILVLVTLGRWLEATGKQRATAALEDLEKQIPPTARRLNDDLTDSVIPTDDIRVGDRLRIVPGDRLPCDGVVVTGTAAVDEHLVSGESLPPTRAVGDRVFGGTFDIDGELVIESTAPACEGALARLVAAVRAAGLARGKYQRMTDVIAAWFLPFVLAVALATMAYHGTHAGFESALMSGLAVLVIACPCALGVATPLAVWSTIGTLARNGMIIGSGEALERLAEVKVILFDKTGTITGAKPRVVTTFVPRGADHARFAHECSALARSTQHPYARAIGDHFGLNGAVSVNGQNMRTLPGRGVVRESNNVISAILGSPRLALDLAMTTPTELAMAVAHAENQGQSVVVVGWDREVRGAFVFGEKVRPAAGPTIESLRRDGYYVAVLTGDTPQRGAVIGRELGVDVLAGLLPDDKVLHMHEFRARFGAVAMVGDGLNDAPALASADVGIALGCGAELSRETADVCLLGDDLGQLPMLFATAKRTVHTIRRNLFWAFAYNLVGLAWAVSGRLNPVIAASAMFLSSVFVVSNSWRLGRTDHARTMSSTLTVPREVPA